MGKNRTWLIGSILVIGLGFFLIGIGWFDANRSNRAQNNSSTTPTPEPIVPTRTITHSLVPLLSTPTQTPNVKTITPRAQTSLYQGKNRWGIGVAIGPISRYNVAGLRLGWYLDWSTNLQPFRPDNTDYAQMVRLTKGTLVPNTTIITQIARANPGSLWLIGNEPDVKWQDNVEPATYAQLYAQAYRAIKDGDSTAQVAVGGVTEPTPLRLKYLETILASYRQQFKSEMPIDVWNIHNFILREERGSWGVDIPPGISDDHGILYEVDDSGNLTAFKKQIVNFRQWMSERGYRNYPLIVSEYGIPMPEDYGFPPERVVAFLSGTFDFFSSAQDSLLGYPADANRLVQRWCWYSLDDTNYATGRLFDPATQMVTETGTEWARHLTVQP